MQSWRLEAINRHFYFLHYFIEIDAIDAAKEDMYRRIVLNPNPEVNPVLTKDQEEGI